MSTSTCNENIMNNCSEKWKDINNSGKCCMSSMLQTKISQTKIFSKRSINFKLSLGDITFVNMGVAQFQCKISQVFNASK